MNKILILSIILSSLAVAGCETTKKAGNATGEVIGEVTNVPGHVTDGGASAVQGKIKKEENPYGR